MANHLQNEASPYLRRHALDPVDWYPWGEEALEKARRERRPIFLSVGYSTCHWCHVMARESFADAEVAAVLNSRYVPVKVDREERSDVDAVYMRACVALNGSGGWPMTLLLTPEGEPFFAAAYLPKENRGGQLGLLPLLKAAALKWEKEPEALERVGAELSAALRPRAVPSFTEPGFAFAERAAAQLMAIYDAETGGFGPAPRFPTPHALLFLLRFAHLEGKKELRAAAEHTLRQMARGGLFDQIGGGFARYSTDREWLVPHFEKTLYDNALLALTYTEAWQNGRFALFRETAERTLDYCLRELRSPEGGFISGQDADSGGEEGAYYLFTPDEVAAVLGADAARGFCECYDITAEGNYRGKSIPNLLLNQRWLLLPEGYGAFREKLRLYRRERLPLAADDKILTGWNGLMLAALARAGRVFGEERYRRAARELAAFLKSELLPGGRPAAVRCAGVTRLPARLDDCAFWALGLLELYRADFEPEDLLLAQRLGEEILRRYGDPAGGFFLTPDDAEKLLLRPKDFGDGALPSGNSAAALLFQRLGRLTAEPKWIEAAQLQLAAL
nr:thioredoxin domain-containing protein [Oscillospiraceae bacterium]